ncbi:hypothetical protein WM40_07490 [Robbsia andropogonis]|uniref:VWFA domain-containing protein n=2 Tax=Robbsia andropogonis TaxID=28092 RepID=A0A0F5K434_9BURK|nr:hypothetical protein WM40_07490 [Robbsia andropogonis]
MRRRHIEGQDVVRHHATVAWPDTLLAARGQPLAVGHLRAVQRGTARPTRTVFLLDCSASMVASGALAHAKGLLMSWLRRVRKRDAHAVVIGFDGRGAAVHFGPGVPRGWHARWLAPLPGGGGTPLQRGVDAACTFGRRGKNGGPLNGRVALVLLTDGLTNALPARPEGFDTIDIVLPSGGANGPAHDAMRRHVGERQAARLARIWGGVCVVR